MIITTYFECKQCASESETSTVTQRHFGWSADGADYLRATRELRPSDSLPIKSAADRCIRRQLREEEDDEDDEQDDKRAEGENNEPILMDQDKTRREVIPVEQLDQIKLE